MLLGVLQGYDIVTCEYKVDGEIQPRPKDAFCIASTTLPTDYDGISQYPEHWANFGIFFVGTQVGFKDWLCLKAVVKNLIVAITGSDFANWDDLNNSQKITAMNFLPTTLINVKGSTWFMTQAGGMYQGKTYLDNYQNNAESARVKRLKTFGDFGYYGLGKDQGLQLERMYQELVLDRSYVIRGVLYESEDLIPGMGDWIMGTNGYGENGLKPLLVAGTFTLLQGFPYTIDQFCGILASNILENGLY